MFDSYSHIIWASQATVLQVGHTFYAHPLGGDFFFRPLGYLEYWVESKWAGFSPLAWHFGGIFIHILATICLFYLCRKTALSQAGCLFAAFVFGLHGSNPEVVTWTAARFDELATLLSIGALIFLCRYVDEGRGLILAVLLSLAAMMSKEAAFCLPGLAVCLLAYRGPINRRHIKAIATLALTALVVLLYRFWVLGGVGGYKNVSGESTALQFHTLHALELLFFRMWSVLVLPINQSIASEWWLSVSLIVAVICLGSMMLTSRPSSRKIFAAVCFCWIALLPASHLALLDATLLGSRVYHLSLVGLALFFGAVYEGLSNVKFARFLAAGVLVFYSSALCHNLFIWRDTARLAGQVCRDFGAGVRDNEAVVVRDLPTVNLGVFFLANAFPECVLVNSGKKIRVLAQPADTGPERTYRWDPDSHSLVVTH